MTRKLSAKQTLVTFEETVYNPGKKAIREDVMLGHDDPMHLARLDHALDLVHTYLREKAREGYPGEHPSADS